MALRYGVLLIGIAFYAFSITTLLKLISNYYFILEEENYTKSFFRVID